MLQITSFNSLIDLLQAFPDEKSCIEYLETLRWGGNVVSPFDPTSVVYKCAGNRYKCKNTNKYFNACTATIFESRKITLKQWFLAIYLFSAHKGISSYKLGADIGVSQKTGWLLFQRLRFAAKYDVFTPYMEGLVQADETFVGGKNKNRHWDKKVKNNQGRSFKDKTPVLGLLCNGKVRTLVIPDTSGKYIQPIVRQHVCKDSILVTDDWLAYRGLSRDYDHQVIDHGRGQYQNDAGFSTNGIEGFWSHFKRGINGNYYKVSRKHLQGYADEYSFRYNNREETINKKFNLLLHCANNKRLTYKQLTAKG